MLAKSASRLTYVSIDKLTEASSICPMISITVSSDFHMTILECSKTCVCRLMPAFLTRAIVSHCQYWGYGEVKTTTKTAFSWELKCLRPGDAQLAVGGISGPRADLLQGTRVDCSRQSPQINVTCQGWHPRGTDALQRPWQPRQAGRA